MEIKHRLQNGKIVHKIIYLKKEDIHSLKSDEVLIKDLPSFLWIDSFLSLAGSILYEREDDRKPNDIDIIVRAQEKDGKFWIVLDPALRLKIDRILEKRFGKKSVEWIASTYGPNWRALPLYDLALIPRKSQKIIEMNEPEFANEFYKEENYEEFCDFGSGHFSKFVKEYPEFNIEEFREYVIVHNKADRDSGELEDIASSEILRLAKEFAQEKDIQIKKRHSREKCMECDKPPVYECLWAEGIGHAWFCKKHFKEWATTGDGKGEIISVKEVEDGIAAKKYGDNRNPNIWAELKREFAKEFYKKLSTKQKEEYERETAIINENKKKPQAKEVHEFKAAKYTHPNGHPRCLICGDEEPIGGVCNMPDSWYQKHEFDDEEAWKKEREILREKGIIKQGMNWVNSPTFAYQAIFHKLPDIPLRGRTDSPKRMWNDKEVDKEFKNKWLEDLNNIPDIEIRATDIGHSTDRVAFVVFRFKDKKNDSKAKDIADSLNKLEGLYCKNDIGAEGRPRICVAGKIKLGDKGWEEWWNGLAGKIGNVIKKEFEKLDLEEFKQTGIDDDLKNPIKRWRELLADLRYLFNSGYPKLKKGEKWGEWDLTTLLKYGAKIIDTLRTKCYFTLIPPKIGEEKFRSSYWTAYRKARQYMKTKPPKESGIKEWDEKRREIIKQSDKDIILSMYRELRSKDLPDEEIIKQIAEEFLPIGFDIEYWEKKIKEVLGGENILKRQEIAKFKFLKVDKKEFIVGGVVYPCQEEDSQGDFARAGEIWKAMKNFMIKGGKIKVMHKGISRSLPVVECFQPEIDTFKGGRDEEHKVRAGDWWLAIFLGNEKDIWNRVEKGELRGFSIAGRASTP